MSHPPTHSTNQPGAWDQVEQLLDELTVLSQQKATSADFYAALIAKAVHALAAEAGAAWVCGEAQQMRMVHHSNFAATGLLTPETESHHARLLDTAMQTRATQIFQPGGATASGGDATLLNPSPCTLIVCPVLLEEQPVAVVEIAQRANASPSTVKGSASLLEAFCQIAADFETLQLLRSLRQRESQWNEIDGFAQRVNQSLSLDRTAFVAANEARTLLNCDRVTILTMGARRARVVSVSGIDTVDRRSAVVQSLEALAASVVRADHPLWMPSDESQLPPQIETCLQNYIDVSHSRSLVVLPLYDTTSNSGPAVRLGAIVAEKFDEAVNDAAFRQRLEGVARHTAIAMDNALAIDRIPMLPTLKTLGAAGWFVQLRQLPFTVTAVVAAVVLALVLVLVPGDFNVYGRGELKPATQQTVFAPLDAQVKKLHLPAAGSDSEEVTVKKDALLIELFSDEITYEMAQVAGQRLAAAQELDTLRKAAVKSRPVTAEARARHNEMNARILQLEETVKRLDQEEKILVRQTAQLRLHALIDGRVLDWNVKDLLATRPVRQGQVLMTLADVNGPWELEIEVPGKHAGYALQHRQQIISSNPASRLQVEYILAADPGKWQTGTVTSIAPATTINDQGVAVVRMKVKIDKTQIAGSRPGAAVVARIYCGRKPLGYVWLHDAIEAARTWLFF